MKEKESLNGFLESLDKEKFEIKRDAYRNGRMFIEFEQNPSGREWKPSRNCC